MLKFNIKDLNQKDLEKSARDEATLIYGKESTRRNRTFKEIYETTLYGKAAEQYLIEKHNYKDDPRIYKDVIDTNNIATEVKVTQTEAYVPYVLKRANVAAREAWRKYPEKLLVFISSKNESDYTFYKSYMWNKRSKVFEENNVQNANYGI